MTKPKTLTEEDVAAVKLTRTSVPSVGGLQAFAAALETEAALDHRKALTAEATVAAYRPADALFETEFSGKGTASGRYESLANALSAAASVVRNRITSLLASAQAAAATPVLTRK